MVERALDAASVPSMAPARQSGGTLTRNLFWGRGEGELELKVLEGHWPSDLSGHVFIVGPDKRAPGQHWFHGHGLLCRIDCRPSARGTIRVKHRLVDTPLKRLRDRYPQRFRTLFEVLEVSPFGFTNFANTNVQALEGRLFVGYDAGRPVEIDPVTLDHITPVGAVDEWRQILPAPIDPLISVAAHPASDWEERALYFLNYVQLTQRDAGDCYVARWDLEGPVRRWRVEGMSRFDSVHDIKATRNHLVFTDLPFVQDPGASNEARRRIQDHTLVWIVRKADLRATPVGGTVRATEVRLPIPTGHVLVDYAEGPNGELTVHLQHAPGTDLMLTLSAESQLAKHAAPDGSRSVAADFFGLPAFAPQPCVIGRYRIDPVRGTVLEHKLCFDENGIWGPLLATNNQYTREAQEHPRQLFYGGLGFHPELLSERYFDLYRDAESLVVPLSNLPDLARPGGIMRFDLEKMEAADAYHYQGGAFPHPPTFVPRTGAKDELDGYVITPVHQDGAKEIHVFDARDLARGPIARAGAPEFCPPLLLHSYWMPERQGPRPSRYRVSPLRDALGALKSAPREIGRMLRFLASEVRSRHELRRTRP